MNDVFYGVILGCPRSGTTFLMRALRALPMTECVTGVIYPPQVPHLVNGYLPPDALDALAFALRYQADDYLANASGARHQAVYRWLCGEMGLRELLQALRWKRRLRRLIYKEPFLAFAPEFVYNALPDCRIVYLHRDGRDVADSLVRVYDVLTDEKLKGLGTTESPCGRRFGAFYAPWWVPEGQEEEFFSCCPYVRSVWMWKEIVRRCHEFFSAPEVRTGGRVYWCSYEALMRDPLRVGGEVVEHLQSSMIPRVRRRLAQAHVASIGVYRRRPAEEVRRATEVAARELELYGYLDSSTEGNKYDKPSPVRAG